MSMADDEKKESDNMRGREEIDWGDAGRWGEFSSVEKGWEPIVLELDRRLREKAPGFQGFLQVKEKFGSLRAYPAFADGVSEEARRKADLLVRIAEERADATCERCGQNGRLREDRSWLLTLCDGCHEGAPDAGEDDSPEDADSPLRRRLRLTRALRELNVAARNLERRPGEIAASGVAEEAALALERLWRSALASLADAEGWARPEPDGLDPETRRRYRRFIGLVDAVRGAHRAARRLQEERPEEFAAYEITGDDADELERMSFAVLRGFSVFLPHDRATGESDGAE